MKNVLGQNTHHDLYVQNVLLSAKPVKLLTNGTNDSPPLSSDLAFFLPLSQRRELGQQRSWALVLDRSAAQRSGVIYSQGNEALCEEHGLTCNIKPARLLSLKAPPSKLKLLFTFEYPFLFQRTIHIFISTVRTQNVLYNRKGTTHNPWRILYCVYRLVVRKINEWLRLFTAASALHRCYIKYCT